MITVNQLSNSDYLDLTWATLKQLEGARTLPYLDTASTPNATIGVGFNISANDALRKATLRALGLDPDAEQDGTPLSLKTKEVIDSVTATPGATSSDLQDALDAMVADWTGGAVTAFQLPDASDTTLRPIWDEVRQSYEDAINSRITNVQDSRERAVLFSLAYQSANLIGEHLTTALNAGDRAEAWYEIRYNSNLKGNVAKRRYVESHLFGLYDDVTGVQAPGLANALKAFRMFTNHEQRILSYDATYVAEQALADAELTAIEGNLGSTADLGAVQDRAGSLSPAFNVLKGWYAGIRGSLDQALVDAGFDASDFSAESFRNIFVAVNTPGDGEVVAHTVDREAAVPDTLWSDANDGTHATSVGRTNDLILGSIKEDDSGDFSDDSDTLKGGAGDDIIIGGGGGDTLSGGAGQDLLIGGEGDDDLHGDGGNDFLVGGSGNDTLSGGAGTDTLDYSGLTSGDPAGVRVDVALDTSNHGLLNIAKDGLGADGASEVERIIGGDNDDTFEIVGNLSDISGVDLTVDAGAGGNDEVDLRGLDHAAEVNSLSTDTWQIRGTDIILQNFETLRLSDHGDNVDIKGIMWTPDEAVPPGGIPYYTIHGGNGDDHITFQGAGGTIYGGGGNDVINASGWGTQVYGGGGANSFQMGFNIGILDADADDALYFGDTRLGGAGRSIESESTWAIDNAGFRYAINSAHELVVRAPIEIDGYNFDTYVANYTGGPGIADDTLGIETWESSIDFYRLLDPNLPKGSISSQLDLLDYSYKLATGEARRPGADPLVLDLDGDGLELTPQTSVSAPFDTDGDGFAERSGWVYSDDGFLARDLNGNGEIDDVSELFGNATQSGFAELATLDSNGDGVCRIQLRMRNTS